MMPSYGTVYDFEFISDSDWGLDTLKLPTIDEEAAVRRMKYFAALGKWEKVNQIVAALYVAEVEMRTMSLLATGGEDEFLDEMESALDTQKYILQLPASPPTRSGLIKVLRESRGTTTDGDLAQNTIKLVHKALNSKSSKGFLNLQPYQWAIAAGVLFSAPLIYLGLSKILTKNTEKP